MNLPLLTIAILALSYFPYRIFSKFRQNLKAAKASGLPYSICPFYFWNQIYILFSLALIPILSLILPNRWRGRWFVFLEPEVMWKTGYELFGDSDIALNSDTWILVTPESNLLVTADPAVITQMTTRRNDFPKPIAMYAGIDIYGKNVVTTEGSVWRRHRKSTISPFGEKNNILVWEETIFQTKQMLKHWRDQSASKATSTEKQSRGLGALVEGLSHDAMRLSLNVISRAGFDVRCEWPGQSSATAEGVMSATQVPEGHQLSYMNSLESLLQRLVALILAPVWLLELLPIKATRLAALSFREWGKYMNDLYEKKSLEVANSNDHELAGMDLMAAMIKSSSQDQKSSKSGDVGLSKDEILGNSFVLFLAGHETAANTIHFAMLFLAMNPAFQRTLQAELEDMFPSADPTTWSYDTDLPRLFSTHAGAVMNEALRVVPPVVMIPKCTLPNSPQPLTVSGKDYIVPENCAIGISATAVHRNPKHWPHGKATNKYSRCGTDLDEFKPERWFNTSGEGSDSESDGASSTKKNEFRRDDDGDAMSIDATPDTSSSFFKPKRGVYIPFSEGARACLGRRFAQVEILAAIAVIFRTYSVELAVDEWADEADVETMGEAKKREVWEKAKADAERKMREEMGTIITIQLRGKPVKVRIVERGREQFDWKV